MKLLPAAMQANLHLAALCLDLQVLSLPLVLVDARLFPPSGTSFKFRLLLLCILPLSVGK